MRTIRKALVYLKKKKFFLNTRVTERDKNLQRIKKKKLWKNTDKGVVNRKILHTHTHTHTHTERYPRPNALSL